MSNEQLTNDIPTEENLDKMEDIESKLCYIVEQRKTESDRKGPLFFEANEDGAAVVMRCFDDCNYEQIDLKCHLQYSTDKMETWVTYDGRIVELDECTDNRVYFRADPENPNTDGLSKQDYSNHEAWTTCFKTYKSVKAGGNIQFLLESTGTRTDVPEYGFYHLFGYYNNECVSLTQAPALPATTLAYSCYGGMFRGCSSLTQAPALPATTLAKDCYKYMFLGCTSLTKAPALPATTLADYCYKCMFWGCSALTQAPELPATTLAYSCYECMFQDCSALTQVLELPATTLAYSCYSGMFSGCTSLTKAPELPATTLADYCYYNMFAGCKSLTQAPALQASYLASSCYSYMFYSCTSLTKAPALPATKMAPYCYSSMFASCTSLTQAPALPATTLDYYCYSSMFDGCSKLASVDVNFIAWPPMNVTINWMYDAGTSATGEKTFTCLATLPKTTGDSNIPSGWTIIEK